MAASWIGGIRRSGSRCFDSLAPQGWWPALWERQTETYRMPSQPVQWRKRRLVR